MSALTLRTRRHPTLKRPLSLGRSDGSFIRQEVRAPEDGGKAARTHYRVLAASGGLSLVRLALDTGRTHQIRVHLSSLDHAILGDAVYRGRKASRLMLHAKHLELRHPFTQEIIRVTATSESFERIMKKIVTD